MSTSSFQERSPQQRPPAVVRNLTPEERTTAAKIAAGKWTPEECELIWSGLGGHAKFQDFQRFLYFCVQKDLDPLLNEVHAEFKWSNADSAYKMAIITHIEAYRRLADQTGTYDGQEEQFDERDGRLVSCTIRTYRKDCTRPFPYTAFYDEYKPANANNFSNWIKMPHVMLRKVAEAASLRCAFPRALAGAYIGEEMSQASASASNDSGESDEQSRTAKPQQPPPAPETPQRQTTAPPEILTLWTTMDAERKQDPKYGPLSGTFASLKDRVQLATGSTDIYYDGLKSVDKKKSSDFNFANKEEWRLAQKAAAEILWNLMKWQRDHTPVTVSEDRNDWLPASMQSQPQEEDEYANSH